MLRVKSFAITDDSGVNELLNKYHLAASAHILISNGSLCVPYEDGMPETNEVKISAIQEKINNFNGEIDLLVHSQKVLELQNSGVKALITKCEEELVTPGTKEAYDKKKELETEIKRLQNVFDQNANQMIMNQSEITLKNSNIAVFLATIDELSK